MRPEPGTTGTAIRDTPRSRRPARRRRSTVVAIYGGLLLAAVLAFASHEWGATAHSVLSLAVIGVVLWHVLAQRRWVTSVVRRRLRHPERALLAVNTALATAFVVANASGFPVWLWHVRGPVEQVHLLSAVAFLVLVAVHLVLNRSRLLARLRRRPGRPRAA